MPEVGLLEMGVIATGQQVKRRQPQIAQVVNRPAVAAVGRDVAVCCVQSLRVIRRQLFQRGGAGGIKIGSCPGPVQNVLDIVQCGPRRRTDRGVLVQHQVPRLGRPRQQFGVQTEPVGVQRFPEPADGGGLMQAR
jgi:hypothetical protein